jgi:hypothetical protein
VVNKQDSMANSSNPASTVSSNPASTVSSNPASTVSSNPASMVSSRLGNMVNSTPGSTANSNPDSTANSHKGSMVNRVVHNLVLLGLTVVLPSELRQRQATQVVAMRLTPGSSSRSSNNVCKM